MPLESSPDHPQPLRVVVDTSARTPLTARALQGDDPALVVSGPLLEDPGYPRHREVARASDGRVDLLAPMLAAFLS